MGMPSVEDPPRPVPTVPTQSWSFEVIQALPGLCKLGKRSPTLDGQLPLRAAQHCSPVFEGNEAGFQISLEKPMKLSRNGRGHSFRVDMTEDALALTEEAVRDAIEGLLAAGLLERNGYWHRLLAEDAMPIRGNRISLWSGFLVRPAPEVALRVGGAFNRRSRIAVLEHAIADPIGFTPLVLEIDGRRLGREPTWIADEIGCVLPVARHSTLSLGPIRRAPELVAEFESFFDAHYFETKKVKPTGKYRRMVRESSGPPAPPAPTCEGRVYSAGPAVHVLSSLRRFHHPGGVSTAPPRGAFLPECVVKNIAPISVEWDGQMFTREHQGYPAAERALARDWRAAGGHTTSDGYAYLEGYLIGPGRDEPYWLLQPWIFAVTPEGWSSVVDGFPAGGSDGMRGIIRTDQFHTVAMVYRMYAPGPIVVRRGAPLMRFFPIARALQDAPMRVVDL
jgi:hypothetical protein